MAVTATVGGESGGAFSWRIDYDDQTRAVTTTAAGTGYCLVTVQITNTLTRTVAYSQPGGTTQNADLAARMAAADFQVVADGSTVTLATGVNPNQVSRVIGKAGQAVGGLPSTAEWRPV